MIPIPLCNLAKFVSTCLVIDNFKTQINVHADTVIPLFTLFTYRWFSILILHYIHTGKQYFANISGPTVGIQELTDPLISKDHC